MLAVSPLQWSKVNLDAIIALAKEGCPIIVGSEPQGGTTGPAPLAGQVLLNVAETLAGITLGATFNFVISRALGVPFVNALFKRENVERTRKIANSPKARVSFFLFFLIPGIPKDILCYVAGLSIMKLHIFLLFSTLGRIPGILGN